jgi:hypothetical protein
MAFKRLGSKVEKPKLRAMVKVYDIILTFDTTKPNEQIKAEAEDLIEKINEILAKNLTDTLPQIFLDKQTKVKIAIVPTKPDEDIDPNS